LPRNNSCINESSEKGKWTKRILNNDQKWHCCSTNINMPEKRKWLLMFRTMRIR